MVLFHFHSALYSKSFITKTKVLAYFSSSSVKKHKIIYPKPHNPTKFRKIWRKKLIRKNSSLNLVMRKIGYCPSLHSHLCTIPFQQFVVHTPPLPHPYQRPTFFPPKALPVHTPISPWIQTSSSYNQTRICLIRL